ncbi:hypothetical protein EK904_005210 [Melospiza melodia maxima]|nr:hypothetical protein EK904_005210 [Melospiza melodia maxima]
MQTLAEEMSTKNEIEKRLWGMDQALFKGTPLAVEEVFALVPSMPDYLPPHCHQSCTKGNLKLLPLKMAARNNLVRRWQFLAFDPGLQPEQRPSEGTLGALSHAEREEELGLSPLQVFALTMSKSVNDVFPLHCIPHLPSC